MFSGVTVSVVGGDVLDAPEHRTVRATLILCNAANTIPVYNHSFFVRAVEDVGPYGLNP